MARARNAVTKADLHITIITKVARERRGTVIAQSPAAGSGLPGGSAVQVTVSKGWPTVPDFDGFNNPTIAVAKTRLRRAGFRFGGLVWKYDGYASLYSPRRVFGSTPDGYTSSGASKTTAPGTRVTLVVARPYTCTPGYSPCLPPHLTGGGFPTLAGYDCAGNEGDGPYYVYTTVRVTGDDVYGLDRDNDGYGCD